MTIELIEVTVSSGEGCLKSGSDNKDVEGVNSTDSDGLRAILFNLRTPDLKSVSNSYDINVGSRKLTARSLLSCKFYGLPKMSAQKSQCNEPWKVKKR